MGRYEDTCFESCSSGLPWWGIVLVVAVVFLVIHLKEEGIL